MANVSFEYLSILAPDDAETEARLHPIGGHWAPSCKLWLIPRESEALVREHAALFSIRCLYDTEMTRRLNSLGGFWEPGYGVWIVPRASEEIAREHALELFGSDELRQDQVDLILVVASGGSLKTTEPYLNVAYFSLSGLEWPKRAHAEIVPGVELLTGRLDARHLPRGGIQHGYFAPQDKIGVIRVRGVARARAEKLSESFLNSDYDCSYPDLCGLITIPSGASIDLQTFFDPNELNGLSTPKRLRPRNAYSLLQKSDIAARTAEAASVSWKVSLQHKADGFFRRIFRK